MKPKARIHLEPNSRLFEASKFKLCETASEAGLCNLLGCQGKKVKEQAFEFRRLKSKIF